MANIVITPGSVSHGTLKEEDLIHATLAELIKVNPSAHDKIFQDTDYQQILWWCKEFDSVPAGSEETAQWLIDEAIDALNEVAPEGYYFGSHEGDSSDLGWWEHETEVHDSE